ncbi:MAG TPA: CoA pyrophosphatase [Longimicrobiaceae bacterium]|nr:CoA pyrophosphatase [Longimicrobiaceae bacterium]
MHDFPLELLRDRLAARPARRASDPEAARAAVALVLRPAPEDIELLLIKRAVRVGDPWSGHMALPGGRSEPGDADASATAVRETREEVGIDVTVWGPPLGSLSDVAPRSGAPRIVVSPFVFAVPAETVATPNPEVEAAVWIPLRELAHPDAATEYLLGTVTGDPRRFPAFGTRGYVIWGLTHRILTDFLEVALPLPEPEGAL